MHSNPLMMNRVAQAQITGWKKLRAIDGNIISARIADAIKSSANQQDCDTMSRMYVDSQTVCTNKT